MKIAIMQPYIFPYIGYFQLVNAVDVFVFYDDVNFIKRGWINRNQILVNNEAILFSVPLKKVSQNKLIKEIELGYDDKWLKQFFATLEFNYKKAPFYEETLQLVKDVFETDHLTIADMAVDSIKKIANHIGLSTVFEKSSVAYPQTKGMDKADRLIEISKLRKAETYINPAGGKELYNKKYFKAYDIDLFFIQNKIVPYLQFDANFVPGLSIIDVMMFNSKEEVLKMLDLYQII